jgi:hypothetical protein
VRELFVVHLVSWTIPLLSCLFVFLEFPGGVDIPDLHQKALRAEKNFENTKVFSVDLNVLERLGEFKEYK